MRVGTGYDIHRLVEGRRLILGGVEIPFEKGLEGHSDADVLAHAVCDALLGAAGLGDIGLHFPDTSPEYKDADSLKLLEITGLMIRERGWTVINIDTVVFAQAPRLAPFREKMAAGIAAVLALDVERVNIKATTTEGLGDIGDGRGIAAMCTVLIAESTTGNSR